VSGFDPDWCIRPGETLKDWREENRLGQKAAATTCAMTLEEYQRVESGKWKISRVTAAKLQQGTGIPARLWLNLERIYRAALAAGKTDVSS
jgi:plasmid maintenance system antidote protein VapI